MKRKLGATEMGVRARWDRSADIWTRLASLALPLTLLSALVFVVGLWSPWLTVVTSVIGGNGSGGTSSGVTSGTAASFTGLVALLHLSPAADRLVFGWYGWLDVAAMVWDVLPLCGIVLSVVLWLRGGASRTLRSMYAAWLVIASIMAVAGFYGTFAVIAGNYCVGDCARLPIMVHARPTWGIWLTFGVLALGWVAFGALARRRTDPSLESLAGSNPSAVRARGVPGMLGAGAFTLGIAIWALGLLLVPWVTAGCTGIPISFTHFVRGSCTGLDGYDVLSAGLVNGPGDAFNTSMSNMGLDPAHIVVLLIFAGVLLAVLLWQPGRVRSHFRTILAVATVWALLDALELLIGWIGVTYRLGHQGILVFGEAPQVVGPGLWLCVVGIALAWLGIGAGWLSVPARSNEGS